jgi:ABC-type branched-subunit amino acid transport system ATPase component
MTGSLEISDLKAGYGGDSVVRSVSLVVESAEAVVVLGPNGAGKTTMLKAVFGELPRLGGSVSWDGVPIRHADPARLAEHGLVQIVEGTRAFAGMSVRDNLELGAICAGMRPDAAVLESVLEIFPRLKARYAQDAITLSGGEKKMLAVGRGLMAKPRLLVIDEPSAGLAPGTIDEIGRALRRLNENGLAILMAEQNLQMPEAMGGRALLMDRGRFTWEGRAENLAAVQQVADAVLGSTHSLSTG